MEKRIIIVAGCSNAIIPPSLLQATCAYQDEQAFLHQMGEQLADQLTRIDELARLSPGPAVRDQVARVPYRGYMSSRRRWK